MPMKPTRNTTPAGWVPLLGALCIAVPLPARAAPPPEEPDAAGGEPDGDWSFEVEDISDDAAALEADLKEGEVQATGEVGTVEGTVSSTTGEPIAGAYVEVVGKAWVARTGIDGRYALDLPPGKWTIVAREELHQAIEQPGVTVTAEQKTTQDFSLRPQGQALVVKVEADANVEGSAGTQLQRQKEVASSDRMSREEISRSGGGSLANVARFIVGATVIDGRFVFVRGLGHRYGNTLLDGARVPSPEPDLRTVPLDIFPSGALGAITVQKSFTPDVPGDFAGGSIQLVTREIPTDPLVSVEMTVEANTQTTFRPMITNGAFPAQDFFGFGNLPRGLPAEIPGDQKVGTGLLDLETFEPIWTPDEVERQGEALYTDTRMRRGANAPLNGKLKTTLGDSWSVPGAGRFGLLGSAEYANKHQSLREIDRIYGGSGSVGELNTTEPQVDFTGRRTTNTVRWSALGLGRWDVTDDHRVELSSLYSRDAEDETREQRGVAPGIQPASIPILSTRIRYVTRSIWFNRLGARHRFPVFDGKHRIQLDYFGSFSRALRDDPAMRSMLYIPDAGCDLHDLSVGCGGILDTSQGGSKAGDQLYMKLVDDNVDGGINLAIPFDQWSGLDTVLRVGAWADGKWRDFGARRFDYRVEGGQVPVGTGNVINDPSVGGELGNADEPFVLRELTRPVDNYRASQRLYAGYGMLTLPFAPWVRVSGGARVEASRIRVRPYDLFEAEDAPEVDCEANPAEPDCLQAEISKVDVLPSAALIFSPKLPEKQGAMNVRLMGSQTLARPEFRELAPFQFTDFVGGFTVLGNENLQQTKIWNAEARWEWFPRPTEVVAVTGFYKLFERPIEQVLNANTPAQQSFINARTATNLGIELELRKTLGFLAGPATAARRVLGQLGVGSNFAYVYSRVKLFPPCYPPGGTPPVPMDDPAFDDYVERPGCKPGIEAVTSRERPLQGQSPYVVNVFVDYDNRESGTFVRVLFNTFGPRIFAVSTQGLPDVYEQPVPGLDVVISQRIVAVRKSRDGDLRNELRFEAGATNVLNPTIRRTQGPDGVTYQTRRGVSLASGLSWSF
jgi:hypothetical protein